MTIVLIKQIADRTHSTQRRNDAGKRTEGNPDLCTALRLRAFASIIASSSSTLHDYGDCQVVLLPSEFHFEGDEVYIKRVGNAVVLLTMTATWQPLIDSLALFSDDFMDDREQPV